MLSARVQESHVAIPEKVSQGDTDCVHFNIRVVDDHFEIISNILKFSSGLRIEVILRTEILPMC